MLDPHADPIQEVRAFKGRVSLLLLIALLAMMPIYALLLDLAVAGAYMIFAMTLMVATVTAETVFRYSYRMRKRIAYPNLLGFVLASTHDFEEACQRSADLAGGWLRARAAVLGWLGDDGQEVLPVATYNMPPTWLVHAPRMSIGFRSLRDAVHRGEVITKSSTTADPWFGGFGKSDHVVYVPLVNRERAIGVLALVGSPRHWEMRDRRLLSGLGMVMAISLDNCRLYEAERERAEHMQQLARMKSHFLMTVSHELRTPLTSIKTAAEMLLEEEEEGEKADSVKVQLIRNIVKGAGRLANLVADLMDASKKDELAPRLEMEPMGAGEVVANAMAVVYPLMVSKQQKLEAHVTSPGPTILVDRDRFEQVLVNLLSNANRFTPVGGSIAIEVRDDDGEVVISVTDSGPGVSADEQAHIFEPFYRGDRSGMGLGLAIAKSLAELHGGRIWVERAPEQGSVFCVAVPAHRDPVLVSSREAVEA
ncbi:MAG: HAMP domain-containing histidine kinase [Chloroflexi bacterium]|nr:HAMP domain-containing histidine kinase [Chloroflexota bacterium]